MNKFWNGVFHKRRKYLKVVVECKNIMLGLEGQNTREGRIKKNQHGDDKLPGASYKPCKSNPKLYFFTEYPPTPPTSYKQYNICLTAWRQFSRKGSSPFCLRSNNTDLASAPVRLSHDLIWVLVTENLTNFI